LTDAWINLETTKKLIIFFRPFFKQSINNYNRVKFDKDYWPYSYGIGVGVKYNFEKENENDL